MCSIRRRLEMAADKLRLPIAILIILIVMSLSLCAVTFYIFQKERAKNLSLQNELDKTTQKQRATDIKLQESQRLVSGLESKLAQAQGQIDILTADLEQEKIAKEETKALIEQLRIDLEQREKKSSQTQNELQNLQARLKELESKKTELESKKTELETKIKDLEARLETQGVELGKIVVAPTVPTEASPEGKVLVINRDYDFAVINLGSKDGIGSGAIFSVYHNNKYIGDVKVEKIYDSMSAAGFISDNLKDKINEGDKVVPKGK